MATIDWHSIGIANACQMTIGESHFAGRLLAGYRCSFFFVPCMESHGYQRHGGGLGFREMGTIQGAGQNILSPQGSKDV
jgi:hypothetical protein